MESGQNSKVAHCQHPIISLSVSIMLGIYDSKYNKERELHTLCTD